MRAFLTSLMGLIAVAGSAAVALMAVLRIDRLADHHGPNARLFFAIVAPFGVVLFGLLVERACHLLSHFNQTAARRSFVG
jgi:hypothetical protein